MTQYFLEQLDKVSEFLEDHGYGQTVLMWQLNQTRTHLVQFTIACRHCVAPLQGRLLTLIP